MSTDSKGLEKAVWQSPYGDRLRFAAQTDKGLAFRTGKAQMQKHMPQLLDHIGPHRVNTEAIVSHHLALQDAVCGDAMVEKKVDRCHKGVLTPAGPAGAGFASVRAS